MATREKKPGAGEIVVLEAVPSSLLNGLPKSDRAAISEIVGTPVFLAGYDDRGRAELEFIDRKDHNHSIGVDPRLLRETTDQNQIRSWIEFHDSEFVAVTSVTPRVELILNGYVHVWEIVGDSRHGSGWMQSIRVSLGGSHYAHRPLASVDIDSGELIVGTVVHSNLVPLPTRSSEAAQLRLEFMDATILELRGTGIEVEAAGPGRYVEDLPLDLWPLG